MRSGGGEKVNKCPVVMEAGKIFINIVIVY